MLSAFGSKLSGGQGGKLQSWHSSLQLLIHQLVVWTSNKSSHFSNQLDLFVRISNSPCDLSDIDVRTTM